MSRLPTVLGDLDNWGTVLNDFLGVSHNGDGTLKDSALFEFTLVGDHAAGATTLALNRSKASWMTAGRQLLAIIDPGNTQTELREAAGFSGSTLTLDAALTFAHSASVPVYLFADNSVSPYWWGCRADSTTDDWAGLQMALINADRLGVWLHGGRQQYQVSKALIVNSSHLKSIILRNAAGFFVDSDTRAGMVMNSQNAALKFTADASTDTFTTASAHGLVGHEGNCIVFSNPGGETMPGGIQAGKLYFLKTVPSTTTLTVAATVGGATVDVTSNGAGWCWGDHLSTGRVFFDDVYIKAGSNSVTGLNGLSICCQQPGYTKDLRIDSAAGGSCFLIQGQISNHYNTELNAGGAGSVALKLYGFTVGNNFHGLNTTDGLHTADCAIYLDGTTGLFAAPTSLGALGTYIDGLWTEGFTTALKIHTGYGITINGWYHSQSGGSTSKAIVVESSGNPAKSEYHVTGLTPNSNTTTNIAIDDQQRGWSLTFDDLNEVNHLNRVSQRPGNVAPEFSDRWTRSKTAAYTAVITDKLIKADATSAAFTVTLPSATNMSGLQITVKRTNSGANNVTVGTTSSQTIDLPGGAAATTRVLGNQYAFVTVESDGTNWMIVAMGGTVT